ncbi:DUF4234 domain-containing protein [Aliagarivorans marinus]|uniref:DUF4234 domain-containing protein n=1 Tax=Aliagarivorans marinus TaxID=561965 RepID=UPI000402BC49|nr:DUF4234 domain-containing protein [Aliagarivorans marinus]
MTKEDFKPLYSMSTWQLFFYTLFTLGVYAGYYVRQLSNKINTLEHDLPPIGQRLVDSIFIVGWLSPVTYFLAINFSDQPAYLMLDDAHSLIFGVLLLVWAFQARNRLNRAFNFLPSDRQLWFHGLWTFVFTDLYINYRINQIVESINAENHHGTS